MAPCGRRSRVRDKSSSRWAGAGTPVTPKPGARAGCAAVAESSAGCPAETCPGQFLLDPVIGPWPRYLDTGLTFSQILWGSLPLRYLVAGSLRSSLSDLTPLLLPSLPSELSNGHSLDSAPRPRALQSGAGRELPAGRARGDTTPRRPCAHREGSAAELLPPPRRSRPVAWSRCLHRAMNAAHLLHTKGSPPHICSWICTGRDGRAQMSGAHARSGLSTSGFVRGTKAKCRSWVVRRSGGCASFPACSQRAECCLQMNHSIPVSDGRHSGIHVQREQLFFENFHSPTKFNRLLLIIKQADPPLHSGLLSDHNTSISPQN